MSLAQIISSYISSWEGHTQIEGENAIRVKDRLEIATIDELNMEYNALTQQHLWNDPLLDLFYEEFRNRMFSDTTFSISTSWSSIEEWMKDPFVLIMVGFEDSYPIIDGNGLVIQPDDPKMSNYTLTNEHFNEKFQNLIIQTFLCNQVDATVEIREGKVQITALENKNVKVSLVDNSNGEPIRVKTLIREAPDWNLYRQIYCSIKNHKPTIIDPMQDIIDANETSVSEEEEV
jgi:hypothetical protein